MSKINFIELIPFALLAVIFFAATPFAMRAVKRANDAAPKSAMRNNRQRLLNLASVVPLLVALVYFAFVSEFGIWPFVAQLVSFSALMLLLRVLHAPWKLRLCMSPIISAMSAIPALLVLGWSPNQPNTISWAAWVSLLSLSGAIAITGALSILSFPEGYGERSS